MKQSLTNGGHLQRGAVAVQVAVMAPILIGFAAFSIDVGLMFNAKTDLQRAADAAALAGVAAYTTEAGIVQNQDAIRDSADGDDTESNQAATLAQSIDTRFGVGDIALVYR